MKFFRFKLTNKFIIFDVTALSILLLLLGIFLQSSHTQIQQLRHYESQLIFLEKEIGNVEKANALLQKRYQNAHDIEWQELVLREKLGVCCQNETKVIFK